MRRDSLPSTHVEEKKLVLYKKAKCKEISCPEAENLNSNLGTVESKIQQEEATIVSEAEAIKCIV